MTGSRERWRELLARTEGGTIPEEPFPGVSGVTYPLLGDSVPGSPCGLQDGVQTWQVRLTWATSLACLAQARHLLEDLDQIEFQTSVEEGELEFVEVPEIYLPDAGRAAGEAQTDVVRVSPWASEADLYGLTLWSRRLVFPNGRVQPEKAVSCGGNLLGNIAAIREALSSDHEARWTLVLLPGAQEHPEELVKETLSALSGILAGVSTLEVRQGVQESLEALTWRVGLLRLLRWEAGLGSFSDACVGAGFFSELRERLRA